MDIIGSMLAYLGCVTGIVGALAISFLVLFASPEPPATPLHAAAMTARQTPAKTIAAAEAKPAAKIAQADNAVAALLPGTETVPQRAVVAGARQKMQMSRAHLRRLVQEERAQEERARRWAYQQDPDFEARFLGYAD
jgi:hypothetical protein